MLQFKNVQHIMLLQERRLNIRTLSWFLFPFLLFNLYLTKSQEIPISMHDMTEHVTITTNIRQTRCRQIGLPALDMTDNWNWIVFLKHLQLWTRRYFSHWSRLNWWWCWWVWMRHNGAFPYQFLGFVLSLDYKQFKH